MSDAPGPKPPPHLEPLMRWILGALELAVSFGHLQSGAAPDRSPVAILNTAQAHLRRLLSFRALAFLTLEEGAPDMAMALCDPDGDRAWLQAEVDAHVAGGAFAWALRHNRPVVVAARSGHRRLVLHALQAGARTMGMFVGVLHEDETDPDEAASHLLSLILLSTAQALLSAQVHARVHAHNQDLERMVAERTRALEKAYGELAEAHAQLTQTAKMEAVGRLAAGIAHDFNNIIQVVQGHSELLVRRLPQDDPNGDAGEAIRQAAYRASDLTHRLLIFSRAQVPQPRPIDLNALLLGIADLLRRLIGEHIQLDTSCAPDLGTVEADPVQLEQVIMNLAVNARDAMPNGGRLYLATSNVRLDADAARRLGLSPGRHVQLVVSDTGCGMDEVTRARAFEPFFTTKEPGRGTGLGLATAYGVVRQSGGAVALDSEPGRGTRFEIVLPRVERAAVTVPPERTGGPGPRGRETILLAEDEDAVRALVRQVLESHGYTVIEARDGTEALGLGQQHRIDLLLTDVVMPGLGGGALAQQLAVARPGVAVLYMSGYAGDQLTPDVAGAALLPKPFTTAGLTRKVREVLEQPRPMISAGEAPVG
jgi:signal transduction histidine kinase